MKEHECREGLDGAQPSGRPEGEAMGKTGPSEAETAFCGLDSSENIAYGCLFCLTGKEKSVVDRIQAFCPEIRAITMRKIKYRTCRKVKRTEEDIVLPSYVFFRAPSYSESVLNLPRENIIRMLTKDGDWRLHDADEEFVRWLFRYDGLLSLSKAYREGDRIRIASGPMKDMEGKIRRVDKRGLSGQVIFSFDGREIPVWLSFELIEPLE